MESAGHSKEQVVCKSSSASRTGEAKEENKLIKKKRKVIKTLHEDMIKDLFWDKYPHLLQ